MGKKVFLSSAALLLCFCLTACQQNDGTVLVVDNISTGIYNGSDTEPSEKMTDYTADNTVFTGSGRTDTSPTEKTEADTVPTTVSVTEEPALEWTEAPLFLTLYVNIDGAWSSSKAVKGSPTVKRYGLNQQVAVVAVTDTDFYKISDYEFIHKSYLSGEKTVVHTTAATVTTTAATTTTTTTAPPPPPVTTTPPPVTTTSYTKQDEFINRYNQRLQEQWEIEFANKVFELTNAERKKNGMTLFKKDEALTKASVTRAWEILYDYRSDHTRPDGRSCSTVFEEVGIKWNAWGENIAAGFSTPESIVAAWMNSPHHRANILSEKFKYLGVGFYYTAKDPQNHSYYWTQEFYG